MYKRTSAFGKHIDFYILDLILFAVSYIIGYVIRFGFRTVDYLGTAPVSFGIILLVIYLLVAIFTRAYHNILYRNKWLEMIYTLLQVVITLVIFLLYLYVTKQSEILPRLMFGYVAVAAFLLIWFFRCVYKNIVRKRYNNNPNRPHLLIVSETSHIDGILDSLRKQKFNDFYLSGLALKNGDRQETYDGERIACEYNEIKEYVLANVVDAVLIAIDDESERLSLAEYLIEAGVVVHLSLSDFPYELPHAMTGELAGRSVLTFSNNFASGLQLNIKRVADIIGGFFGLIITGILYIIIAPQIKAKDPGPALFKQQRVGKNGRIFYIYKFRSMYMDAEERKKELMAQNEMQGFMFKMEDDPRILPGIGHRIRDWSLDEFPQFWNVFKGDMSLVGTRPPTVDEFKQYEAHHKSRLSFKPGITGLWQVSGRSNITDFEEIVRLDNEYIRNWNLGLDLKILIKTVGVVLGRKGSK
ncbi:MAG: sugar transferase [Lachnospiraceae bacterium]|nr:sugar transferase [Lachnospiraceae bacterium]